MPPIRFFTATLFAVAAGIAAGVCLDNGLAGWTLFCVLYVYILSK